MIHLTHFPHGKLLLSPYFVSSRQMPLSLESASGFSTEMDIYSISWNKNVVRNIFCYSVNMARKVMPTIRSLHYTDTRIVFGVNSTDNSCLLLNTISHRVLKSFGF